MVILIIIQLFIQKNHSIWFAECQKSFFIVIINIFKKLNIFFVHPISHLYNVLNCFLHLICICFMNNLIILFLFLKHRENITKMYTHEYTTYK